MKLFTLLVICLLTVGICACSTGVQGSGNEKNDLRKVDPFDSIAISGAYELSAESGKPEQKLEINTDDNLLPLIKTEVSNGLLKIYSTESISPSKTVKISITALNLKDVSFSGAGKISLSGIKNPAFKMTISGAGSVNCTGETDAFDLNISGAGSIDAKDLKVKKSYVSMSGAGSAKVYASEELNAEISGVGSVDYFGNPAKVNQKISGMGKLTKN
ncbi:MAG: DUF2807 domain-containing protein [Candidatus Riflebacteria bacterium]|nr:DUF2807 domain-containing protein [Candidatus Riflebacteria bacterium]